MSSIIIFVEICIAPIALAIDRIPYIQPWNLNILVMFCTLLLVRLPPKVDIPHWWRRCLSRVGLARDDLEQVLMSCCSDGIWGL